MERNIHAYDEDAKWQLAEPNMLMSAKSYREKNVAPLVTMLKDTAKSLTIKCVRFTEENKKLKSKVTKQVENIAKCEYSMDNGYVEVNFTDGNILRINCVEIEANLNTTE